MVMRNLFENTFKTVEKLGNTLLHGNTQITPGDTKHYFN